jgi:tetratricopeptide (TPR) repeat protein
MTPRAAARVPVLALSLALLLPLLAGCGMLSANDRKKGIALYNEGKFAEAIPRLEKALKWKPGDHETRGVYALALTRGGRPNEAIEQWLRVLNVSPNWADGHYWLGIAYISTDRMKRAMEEWVRAADIDTMHVGAHYNLGLAYVKMSLFPLAIEEWSTVLRIDPTHYEARVNRARVRALQGEMQGALEDFLVAVAIHPEVATNWLSLGETYFILADSAHAVASIDSFFARTPEESDIARRAKILRGRIVAGEKAPPIGTSPLGIPSQPLPTPPGQ